MLVSLYIRNFGPVGSKPFELSMQPTHNGATNLDKHYVFETGFTEYPYLMNSIGIFGSNASGKTTIFKVIHYLQHALMMGHKDEQLLDNVFKFSDLKDENSELEICFIQDDCLYNYSIEYNTREIVQETLKIKDKGPRKQWIDIINYKEKYLHSNVMKYIVNKGLSKEQNNTVFWSNLNRNQLALPLLHSKDNCDYFNSFYKFFNEYRMFAGDSLNITNGVKNLDDQKNKIINLLNHADFNITDIFVTTEDILKDEKTPSFLQKILDNKGLQEYLMDKKNTISIPYVDGKMFKISKDKVELQSVKFKSKAKNGCEHLFYLSDLSSGTQTFFTYINVLLESLQDGTVLFIDELEKSLHPYLTNYIVNLFSDKETNVNNAQLIFISHDISLLDKKTLKPEQVYFTSKNDGSLESELYSLAEFNIKNDRDKSYRDKYLAGAFGAVPNMR